MALAAFTGLTEFDPVPSKKAVENLQISTATGAPDGVTLGVLVSPDGELPEASPLDWSGLRAVGFEGTTGQTVPLPTADGGRLILIGTGGAGASEPSAIRDAAAVFARANSQVGELAFRLPDRVDVATAAQMAVEGIVLARYRYDALKKEPTVAALTLLTLVSTDVAGAEEGAERGRALAEATTLARDLANTPPALLTAMQMADVATRLGDERGLTVEVLRQRPLSSRWDVAGCSGSTPGAPSRRP